MQTSGANQTDAIPQCQIAVLTSSCRKISQPCARIAYVAYPPKRAGLERAQDGADVDNGTPSSTAKVKAMEKLSTDMIEMMDEAKQRLSAFKVAYVGASSFSFPDVVLNARAARGALANAKKTGIEATWMFSMNHGLDTMANKAAPRTCVRIIITTAGRRGLALLVQSDPPDFSPTTPVAILHPAFVHTVSPCMIIATLIIMGAGRNVPILLKLCGVVRM